MFKVDIMHHLKGNLSFSSLACHWQYLTQKKAWAILFSTGLTSCAAPGKLPGCVSVPDGTFYPQSRDQVHKIPHDPTSSLSQLAR